MEVYASTMTVTFPRGTLVPAVRIIISSLSLHNMVISGTDKIISTLTFPVFLVSQ